MNGKKNDIQNHPMLKKIAHLKITRMMRNEILITFKILWISGISFFIDGLMPSNAR